MYDELHIAIADDHQMVRDSLKEVIQKQLYAKVVFMADNGRELIRNINKYDVDIVLLDISMPEMDGLQTLKELKIRNPDLKVMVITMYNDEALMLKLIRLKVNGFLLKSGSTEELIRAIESVNKDGFYFNQAISKLMFRNHARRIKPTNSTEVYFSPDETDLIIIRLICEEKTSQEIGEMLNMSHRTVEGRKKKMMENLGIRNQIGLALYAIKEGIVEL